MMWKIWRCYSSTLNYLFNRQRVLKSKLLGRNYNIAACMPEAAGFLGVNDHTGLHEFSVIECDRFWGAVARQRLSWISAFSSVQNCDLAQGNIKWFEGGKINVSGKVTFFPN